MRRRQVITENQLHQIIRECVEDALIEVGFFSQLGGALRGGFGNTANRVGNALSNAGKSAWGGVKNAASAVGNAVGRAGTAVANGVANAYNNTAQAVKDTGTRMKQGFLVQQNLDKINNLNKLLTDLTNNGILSGQATQQAVATLQQALQYKIRQNKMSQNQLGKGNTLNPNFVRNPQQPIQ